MDSNSNLFEVELRSTYKNIVTENFVRFITKLGSIQTTFEARHRESKVQNAHAV